MSNPYPMSNENKKEQADIVEIFVVETKLS